MKTVKVAIVRAPGTNCDIETAHAFSIAGATAERIHINALTNPMLEDYHIIAISGGFAYGDYIASGKIFANKLRYKLYGGIKDFVSSGKLIIGICNGFQSLVKCGLLPGTARGFAEQNVTLSYNDIGRFQDRWVYLKADSDKCIFTRGIKSLYLPVNHGEGKFMAKEGVIHRLEKNGQVIFRYVDETGRAAGFPWNPNGSAGGIAAICNETGNVFGMMPHPEKFLYAANHPRWTRECVKPGGRKIFINAVQWIKENF
ncbi:MAG: phosphoribosylformylglycinamidine synthase I [Candidatus Aenigmarchaeota archaeon]|nr:phosphoribosylformylglycinamidine synthase I [Candidatus Aenigmarchaeota archaeon]